MSLTLIGKPRIEIRNDSNEELPSLAICRVVATVQPTDRRIFLIVNKPDGKDTYKHPHIVNIGPAIQPSAYGAGCCTWPLPVKYDDGNTPSALDEWGPTNDSWLLGKNSCGFRIVGVISQEAGIVLVQPSGVALFEFTLTAELTVGSSATANRIVVIDGTRHVVESGITVYDNQYGDGGALRGESGACGTFHWRGNRRVIQTLTC